MQARPDGKGKNCIIVTDVPVCSFLYYFHIEKSQMAIGVWGEALFIMG